MASNGAADLFPRHLVRTRRLCQVVTESTLSHMIIILSMDMVQIMLRPKKSEQLHIDEWTGRVSAGESTAPY